jgi:monoamine oxidase
MKDSTDILIIGAGAAGLMAARELSHAKLKVIVLEARDRIGGRINTHHDTGSLMAIELGAEFVHGLHPEILSIIKHAHFDLLEVPNRHWHLRNGVLAKSNEFWSKLEDLMGKMKRVKGTDQSFADFLRAYDSDGDANEVKSVATLYIEGFHAARVEEISLLGLNMTNEAADQIHGDRQFRISKGYCELAQWLHDEAVNHGARFNFNAIVEEVQWRPGHVKVITRSEGKIQEFEAARLLITLPLPMLQGAANEMGTVRFVPQLSKKQEAARRLAMGHVVKTVLRFREPFWENLILPTNDGKPTSLKELAFIHAPSEMMPTWWTTLPAHSPVIVGWSGGSRAEELSLESDQSVIDKALESLSVIARMPRKRLEDLLEEGYTHNWRRDPFSLGAYSYIPVGGLNAQQELARSIDDTLFFAGEATNTEGHHGTVHGALATGSRAAQEIIRTSVPSARP